MLKRLMLIIIFVALSLSACGSQEPPASENPPSATPTPTLSTTPTPAEPPQLESLIVAPGGVGPLEVGMTVEQALATGVARKQSNDADDGCEWPELAWLESYQDALDVWVDNSGTIISIGVYKPGPHTVDGVGVGSTLADVSRNYENAEMVAIGSDQTGVFVTDGSRWLGFLFDQKLENVKPTTIVQFLEVTGDSKPSLIRMGC